MVKSFKNKLLSLILISLFIIPATTSIFYFDIGNSSSFDVSNSLKFAGNISNIDLSIIPDINYTALNATWYNPKVEMLIITPDGIADKQAYVDAVTPLMNWNNEKGVKTIIVNNYNSYSGIDTAEKIRNMIKYYYDTENIKWVLLAADVDVSSGTGIPTREVYNPDTEIYGGTEGAGYSTYDKPTDFYYADLTGNWNEDGDSHWGESPQYNANGVDEINWTPEVYVGRFPASNPTELELMVNKTVMYEKNPESGAWMHQMLLAGSVSDLAGTDPNDKLGDGEDECRLTTYIIQNYVSNEMNYKHLYQSTYYIPPDPKELLTYSSFNTYFNSGYSTVFFAGHGSGNVFQCAKAGTIYTATNAASASNLNMPSLVYSDACTTAPFDHNDNNIGENLLKDDSTGAIGYIGGARVTWYVLDDLNFKYVNRGCANMFWKEFFENQKFQQGRALYDSKVSYMQSTSASLDMSYEYQRKNVLTYNLLGDPELDVYTDQPNPVSDPFPDSIYEGQLVSIHLVPYANVHLTTSDGMYYTAHTDENGIAKFRLPRGANITYNVTITGHNYIPTNFSFTTLPDEDEPIPSMDYTPIIPSTLKNTIFNTKDDENKSGIESIYVFMSDNGFEDYTTYHVTNDFLENISKLDITLNRLTPGTYVYSFYVVSRDYANNTNTLTRSFKLTIPIPITSFLFIGSFIIIIGLVGSSIFILYKGIEKHSMLNKRIKDI